VDKPLSFHPCAHSYISYVATVPKYHDHRDFVVLKAFPSFLVATCAAIRA
jgi:hypothetical protein